MYTLMFFTGLFGIVLAAAGIINMLVGLWDEKLKRNNKIMTIIGFALIVIWIVLMFLKCNCVC